jgi:phosphopantetheinyl transferase
MPHDATLKFPELDAAVIWVLVTPEEAAEAYELPRDGWLAPAEQAVLNALTVEGRRREWCAGRLAVKRAVQRWRVESGAPPSSLAQVMVTQDERGAPYASLPATAAGPAVSIAHSDGYGFAAAVAPGAGVRVGVDVERLRDVHPRLLARMLGPDERGCTTVQPPEAEPLDGVTLWTLKEATVKALGLGLRLPMRYLTVHVAGPGLVEIRRVDSPPAVDDFSARPWSATGVFARAGNLTLAVVLVRRAERDGIHEEHEGARRKPGIIHE